jgi:hypothetical protein
MSLRFRRSIKLIPGVRLCLGLHGAGLSVGPRGLHVGVNRRGMYTSAGIPGTSLYAIRHIRSSPADPTVTGAAGGFLVGLLIAAAVIVVVAIARFVSQ